MRSTPVLPSKGLVSSLNLHTHNYVHQVDPDVSLAAETCTPFNREDSCGLDKSNSTTLFLRPSVRVSRARFDKGLSIGHNMRATFTHRRIPVNNDDKVTIGVTESLGDQGCGEPYLWLATIPRGMVGTITVLSTSEVGHYKQYSNTSRLGGTAGISRLSRGQPNGEGHSRLPILIGCNRSSSSA